MATKIENVIIVGAGPCGILAAFMLAKHGIHVEVIEAEKGIDQRPRGLAYGPAAVKVLREAGILDLLRSREAPLDTVGWCRPGGKVIAMMKGLADPAFENRFVGLPVHILAEILRDEFMKLPGARIHWGVKATTLTQDEKKVHVHAVESDDTEVIYSGDFLIGGDGASSIVRKTLLGHDFPGFTWPGQFVATNLYYDGLDNAGLGDLQYIISKDDWGIFVKVDNHGQWRVAYGVEDGLSMQELKAQLPKKMERILPGHPKRDQYRLVNFSPYHVQQRCAEHMRVGRVMLVGDAAHLTNPMGGLGLTTGISDVGSLVQCLVGIHNGKAGLDILDKYDEVRREKFTGFTSVRATQNLKRLFADDEASIENDAMLNLVKELSDKPEEARNILAQEEFIYADMTQYYTA